MIRRFSLFAFTLWALSMGAQITTKSVSIGGGTSVSGTFSAPQAAVTTACSSLGSNCIRAYDFTNWTDAQSRFNIGTGMTFSQETVAPPPGELSALHILWPTCSGSPGTCAGNEPGGIHITFSDNFTKYIGPPGDTTGGTAVLGNEAWIGFWYKADTAAFTGSNWNPSDSAGGEGFKQVIITGGDISGTVVNDCVTFEIVIQNQYLGQKPVTYHSCGVKDNQWLGGSAYQGLYVATPVNTDNMRQNAVGCYTANGGTTWSASCWQYPGNTWMHFLYHIKIGSWYVNNSGNYHRDCTLEVYATQSGTMQLVTSVPDYDCVRDTSAGGDNGSFDWGKIYLTPYFTNVVKPLQNMNFYYGGVLISKTPYVPYGVNVPIPPTGLRAYSTSATAVSLSWQDNANNETGYKVQSCAGDRNACDKSQSFSDVASGACSGTLAAGTTTCTDTVTSNSIHTYRVYALNASGNSAYSNDWPNVPLPPTDLTTNAGDSQVVLSWTNPLTSDERLNAGMSLEAYRCAGNITTCGGPRMDAGSFTKLTTGGCATIAASATTCTDTTAVNGTTYTYRVTSKGPAGYWTPWDVYQNGFSNKAQGTPTAPAAYAPASGWNVIANTTIDTVCTTQVGAPNIWGNTGCSAVLSAWNSCWTDGTDFFCGPGGGHTDYGGNEVYGIRLIATPSLRRMYDPDLNPGTCSDTTVGGKAAARHTYQGIIWVPNQNYLLLSGGVPWCSVGNSSTDTWKLDKSNFSWSSTLTQANAQWTKFTTSTSIPGQVGHVGSYDSGTGKAWMMAVNSNFARSAFEWDATNHTWIDHGDTTGGGSGGQGGDIDPVRHFFYIVGNGQLMKVNLSTFAKTDLATATCNSYKSAGYPSVSYDPVAAKFLLYDPVNVTTAWLDPATDTCSSVTFANTANAPPSYNGTGTIGRMRYVQNIDAHVICTVTSTNCRAVKTH